MAATASAATGNPRERRGFTGAVVLDYRAGRAARTHQRDMVTIREHLAMQLSSVRADVASGAAQDAAEHTPHGGATAGGIGDVRTRLRHPDGG